MAGRHDLRQPLGPRREAPHDRQRRPRRPSPPRWRLLTRSRVMADGRVTSIQLWDFEFRDLEGGNPPVLICGCVEDFFTGRREELWLYDGAHPKEPPFPIDEGTLLVAYGVRAELQCFRVLNWRLPSAALDLSSEFRLRVNGTREDGFSILDALEFHGKPHVTREHKDNMRNLARRADPPTYTPGERRWLTAYCWTDVDGARDLLLETWHEIDWERAVNVRGRYQLALSEVEARGVSIDVDTLEKIKDGQEFVRWSFAHLAEARYPGVFKKGRFIRRGFADMLNREGKAWPTTPTGQLKLDKKTWQTMVRIHPALSRLNEARGILEQFHTPKLAVGSGGQNVSPLWSYASKTGRTQFSGSRYIFGLPSWNRGLILPNPGKVYLYADYRRQEPAVQAALSDDDVMKAAYRAPGCFYLNFAIAAKQVPADATDEELRELRERFKTITIATSYGQSAWSLAAQLGIADVDAAEMLGTFRKTFRTYVGWSDNVADVAKLEGRLSTLFGWELQVGRKTNEAWKIAAEDRTARNFLGQATAAEMTRIALVLAVERGLRVASVVHDALLVEADESEFKEVRHELVRAMHEASELVLFGFRVEVDVKEIRPVSVLHPDRCLGKGAATWLEVMKILGLK
ncbi:MAG: hypothetical protein KIT84_20265 [Labilithrix sp.]|nr:hypothetical protein [Labilithrix sp.]MCW5813375.1 hypothetical protein [Labilithrix sp.]